MSNKIITMKKIILSMAVLLVTAFYANAQDFTLSVHGEVVGDTVVPDSTNTHEIVFEAIFTNHTNNTALIKVARNIIYLMDGDTTYFCWGACYPHFVDTSGMYMEIPAGGSSGELDFSAHYLYHEDVIGVSLIEYIFYNMDNPEEFVKVVVKYDTSPDGINEAILNNISVSEIYPNPASDVVNIDYDMPYEVKEASVKIVNILGAVVKEQQINTRYNKMRINITDLTGGIYFYSLTINGEIYSTKKLIIR